MKIAAFLLPCTWLTAIPTNGFLFGKEQRIVVTGELGCSNNVHDEDVHIELWEYDLSKFCLILSLTLI